MASNYSEIDNLPAIKQKLLLQAKEIIPYAYNIYSAYCVSCALLTSSGKIYRSCNFENASYGLSICAEVGALQSAFSNGDCIIECIAIVGGFPDSTNEEPPMPCGRCRQMISEAAFLAGNNIDIVSANLDLTFVTETNIDELLPHPFNFNNLHLGEKIEIYKQKCRKNET